MTYWTRTVFLASAALMLAPMISFAGSSSTDWTLGPGGLYSFAGGTSSLIGTDIPIVSVLGDSTPSENGVSLSVIDGLLNFTSGAGTSGTWNWASGGTLDITGCIAGVTASCNPTSNVLVNDDFTSVSIVQVGGAIDAVFGNVTGTLEQSVASYFGVPTAFSTGSFTAVIATTGSTGSAFIGTDLLGVLKADPPPVNTPENWSMGESLGFFMIAIIAFGALIRRGALRSHLFQSPGRS
jgi:hypothetical protein